MDKAKMFSLNYRDVIKGLVTTVIGAVVGAVITGIQAGAMPTDTESLKKIGYLALVAGLSYISKNFLTNSNDEILKSEPKA